MARAVAVQILGAAMGLLVAGCSRSERPTDPDASATGVVSVPSAKECVPGAAEKLGIPFVRVCGGGAPFWISTLPMGCSAGEHDTLHCPPVLALVQPPTETPPSVRPAVSSLAAVVDSELAHRVCTMRFAGRLPTREERVRARELLGLATVVVSDSPEVGGHRLRQLAEWVTARPCDEATKLAPECGAARFPWDASPYVPWRLVVRCTPRTDPPEGAPHIDLDGDCPGSKDFGCVVRGALPLSPARRGGRTALSCEPPQPPPAHDAELLDTTAFRCVIPEWR